MPNEGSIPSGSTCNSAVYTQWRLSLIIRKFQRTKSWSLDVYPSGDQANAGVAKLVDARD